MRDDKDLIVKKESFFTKIINRIKDIFIKEKKENSIQKIKEIKESKEEYNGKIDSKKKEFFDNIKVESNSEILYLKIKLENGEVKAIDLTDEQIDELQKIYDKEIEEKKNKIKKLKSAM